MDICIGYFKTCYLFTWEVLPSVQLVVELFAHYNSNIGLIHKGVVLGNDSMMSNMHCFKI
jgi:hypothetical protein